MNAKSPKLPPQFEKQVREACKHYNKPQRIGKLSIASLALQVILLQDPSHPTDLVGRGQALQSVIKENLLKLEPKEKHSREWEIYLCLSCYIFQRAYSINKSLKNVQIYIEINHQIPKATYNYRLKKEGIPQLSYLISSYLSEKIVWIEPIPQIGNFIGRENELADYRQQLEQNKMAVIEGVGGIGKTALAAQLASSIKHQDQRAVCWVTLRAGLNDSPMDILYAWAAFFAQHDYPQLWAFMRATATEEKRLPEYYPILRDGLAQVKPLLCIDNLELLPKSEDGFWELLSMVQQEAHVSLLLTSQQRPLLSSLDDYELLSGLPLDKVRDFLTQREVELTDRELKEVVDYTLGNLRLLDLWTAYVRQQAGDIQTSLEKLRQSSAASAFLTSEVINALTTGQQQAARLLALCRSPLDRFILQEPPRSLPALSDFDIELDDFIHLQQLGLIQEQSGNLWSLSRLLKDPLIKPIGQDSLLREEVIELHDWLANLYILQNNTIEAAYHALESEKPEQAILWLAEQQNQLIEQGLATAMYKMLEPIQTKDLNAPIRQLLHQLRRELLQLFGNYNLAEIEARAAEKEAITKDNQASTIHDLGELERQRGNLVEAVNYYKKGLHLLEVKNFNLENWLHRDLAWVLTDLNDLDNAWNEGQRAQMALNNTLGNIAQRRGEFELALNYYQNAVRIGEKYGEHRQLMRVRNSMAILYSQNKQLEQALPIYQKNLETIEEIGEFVGKAITLLNLGLGYAELGQFHTAIEYTTKALSIFKDLGDARGQMFANQNLAEQYRQISELDNARQYAEVINEVDETLKTTREYAEGLRIYAEVLFAQKELSPALKAAQEALNILQKSDKLGKLANPFNTKSCYETLARIHTALGNTAETEKYDALANRLAQKHK